MPVLITAKVDGFRRCGLAHRDITTSYADDHFTAAQLAELQAEPMLVVSVVSEGDGPSQPADTQMQIAGLTDEVSRLTNALDSVTAERDSLKKALAELNKDMKKNARTEKES
ncbi:HI1506-related protein [Xenorhabdus miraniensis]|uniref:Mu-like prophage FluMu N-terminal domain-containing protein n=1 Tax=Xenorhabdus miraniensis TaxID=351674 RepID=A0A2D0JLB3_9GAMM|nr:HI1506-related protein [Xenorhabdus miraniensis]PHM47092.1 hypothetical protein Xmir_03511 [Xenorhabdus miraniensis]